MSCNCKNVNSGDEIKKDVKKAYESQKIGFFNKIKIIWDFLVFYFFYVNTAVINFIVTDKLEPVIPTKLLKKYADYQ